ncbi:YigZ family protein [Kineococcus rhizosphaerae]|uniref:Putative YigZ family protein n=1 Tax=Kineococcus rhizosphaerae TaxID=559628 RepID=A0A2T0R6L3_9ACTN|nr:YigZ family protein [Kineococcus rhizosphaerae]PRY16815.1 putative YigZ family protein [Kineococcus rhizosphaerae]
MREPLPVPARGVRTELVVERSRFLTTLEPVSGAGDVDAVVARVREEFGDARHHCTASVLGEDGGQQRSGDDGEPAGTAGAPMLAALNGAGVTGVVTVVTRYFGGVLLGTGGLVRAYGGSVSAALAEAGVVRRRWVDLLAVRAPLADGGRVEAALRRTRAVEDVQWAADGWRAVVAAPVDGRDALAAELAAAGLPATLEPLGRAVRPSP